MFKIKILSCFNLIKQFYKKKNLNKTLHGVNKKLFIISSQQNLKLYYYSAA